MSFNINTQTVKTVAIIALFSSVMFFGVDSHAADAVHHGRAKMYDAESYKVAVQECEGDTDCLEKVAGKKAKSVTSKEKKLAKMQARLAKMREVDTKRDKKEEQVKAEAAALAKELAALKATK